MANYIDVTASPYNADNTGNSSATAAIEEAISDAFGAEATVYFPRGTYLLAPVSGPPPLPGTVSIGPGSHVRLQGDGAILQFDSTSFPALSIDGATDHVTISDLFFQGNASSDDAVANSNAAIVIGGGAVDIEITKNTFDHCVPVQADDSPTSRRLRFTRNYCHNCSGGMHPTSDSTIEDNDFVCDAVVSARGQAIYAYGQFENVAIRNNRFKSIAQEDIQIRATAARYLTRGSFRIEGNHFEESNKYSIWVGSDDHPDIGETVITGNTFKNCNCALQAQGNRSVVFSANHIEYTWEFPYTLGLGGSAVVVSGGIGQAGHYNTARGCIVNHNKFLIHHPFAATVTLNCLPHEGDTLTVGEFTYTWRALAHVSSPGDVEIDATGPDEAGMIRISTDNLRKTILGRDMRAIAPCNVLRYATDVMNNYYGVGHLEPGTPNYVVAIVSGNAFSLSESTSGVRMTVSGCADMRTAISRPIEIDRVIAPLVQGNVIDDFAGGIQLTQCVEPTVVDNILTNEAPASIGIIAAYGNVFSRYRGNRLVQLHQMKQGRLFYSQVSDGFPIFEDDDVATPQLSNTELTGRSGIVSAGDGKAYAWLYYGMPVDSLVDATTRPYRWDDGDVVRLYNSGWTTFTFKRTSPGAGEFNDADSLIALINATGVWTAGYASFQNDLGNANPKLMIRIAYASAGDPGDTGLDVKRFKDPTDSTTYRTVPQPLLNGIILRNTSAGVDDEFARLYGGGTAYTRTFVHTPLANPKRGVFVQGVDAASQSHSPRVYQADIIPGVGFTITHDTGSGFSSSDEYFFRVN